MTYKRNRPSNSQRRDTSTLDWDAVRRRNAERLDAEILRGVDNPETRKRLREREQIAIAQLDRPYLTAAEADRFYGQVTRDSTPKPPAKTISPRKPQAQAKPRASAGGDGKGTPGYRLSTYEVAEIIDAYNNGMKPDDIAMALGVTNKTVIQRLRRAGIYDPDRFKPAGPEATSAATKARWSQTTQPNEEYL